MAHSKGARRLRWVLGLTGVVAVALISFTGYQALQARDALQVVADEFEQIADDLRDGDTADARERLEVAQEAAADARTNTRGPGWWLTSRLPRVGDDVIAIRTIASVTDDLAQGVLPDVVGASETLDPDALRPQDGSIALEPIEEVARTVVLADAELHRQASRIDALDTAELNPQIAAPVELLQAKLREVTALSSKASFAVRLLPSMLGAEGERSYLVLFQNNAEVRATGGIPGAYATLTADQGRIEIGTQGAANDLRGFDDPVLPLTEEEQALYGEKMVLFAQNLNFTPDFPRTAELAQAMWESTSGETVDGVLSVDPVALSYVLGGTGPVTLDSGEELTADNVVRLLLSEIYLREPKPARQDAFFASAAQQVFDAVASGAGEPQPVLEGVARAASENRLLVWSDSDAEQSLLESTQLAGRVPTEPTGSPFVGVFLNDGTGAKMQYYLDHTVDVEPVACNTEGRQQVEITVRLRSTAPADAADLPAYIVGMAEQLGIRPGSMRVGVHLYAPLGGWIEESALDGEDIPMSELDHLGRAVGTRTVEIAPGQERVLTYTLRTGLDQTGDVRLRTTPGVRGDGVGTVADSVC